MPYHNVRAGESLSSIATRYHTSWQALARVNHLQNPDRLAVGQRLTIPARMAPRRRSGRQLSCPCHHAPPRYRLGP